MEILNKYKRDSLHYLVDKSKVYDFALSLDKEIGVQINGSLTQNGLISYIDFTNSGCVTDNGAQSLPYYRYDRAINSNPLLLDYGFTGVDNGSVSYPNTISQEEFIGLLTGSPLYIDETYDNLILDKVNGNTHYFNYACGLSEENGKTYYSFNGGFLQGFYKLEGEDYQILPQHIADAWTLDFVIRPRDYEHVTGETINDMHSGNTGIFFYIGARGENKFARFYKSDIEQYDDRQINSYIDESGKTYELETSNSHKLESNDYFEVTTNNKYLFFNRTKSGFTVDTWDDDNVATIIQSNPTGSENLYLYMNRTKSGHTTDDIDKYLKEISGKTDYKIINDIKNNAFALKYNTDGSISYKYLIRDCDSENGWSVAEESTLSGLVTDNEWNSITVVFKSLGGNLDECETPYNIYRKMKMWIYVNGFLKFVSKELPCFNFRALNDFSDKQEGVPFNISLGGGTQGLIESMWTDNYVVPFYKILPIEKNFCGSFIGDMRSFKFYNRQLELNEIRNNSIQEGTISENIFC